MNKTFKKYTAILFSLLLIISLAACGSKSESEDSKYVDYNDSIGLSSDISSEEGSYNKSQSGDTATSLASKALEGKNVKLVYRASLYLQTQDFDEGYSELVSLTEKYKGYFESCEIDNGSYYDAYSNKYGEMVVRIPTESYNDFIKEVGESIHISSKSESVENIGQSYYETETHIATLKVEISRLQELMTQAADMSDIITIEKALAEAENELEQYQSTLAGYDSLIEYSTITITLRQVEVYTGNQETFWEKIASAFAVGWENFVYFWESLLLWIIEHIFGLIVLAVLIILCRKFKLLRKIKDKIFKKKQQAPLE